MKARLIPLLLLFYYLFVHTFQLSIHISISITIYLKYITQYICRGSDILYYIGKSNLNHYIEYQIYQKNTYLLENVYVLKTVISFLYIYHKLWILFKGMGIHDAHSFDNGTSNFKYTTLNIYFSNLKSYDV